jgi:hypothetical protein
MDIDAIFGPGGLATRFAWAGAVVSAIVWAIVVVQIWRVEGSTHHLVARVLSSITMLSLDAAVVILFWPRDLFDPVIRLSPVEARALVAFVVGMQIMAALWQLTAPRQGRVKRTDGKRTR